MTILISYPIYFGPLRTMVKSKIRIYFIELVLWPKSVSKSPDFAKVCDFDGFWPKSPIMTYLMKQIRIFDFTIALTESKYIGYGIKIVTF